MLYINKHFYCDWTIQSGVRFPSDHLYLLKWAFQCLKKWIYVYGTPNLGYGLNETFASNSTHIQHNILHTVEFSSGIFDGDVKCN